MDRLPVEKKDREVLEKLRSAVEEKDLMKKTRVRMARFFGALLTAGCIALLVIFIYPAGKLKIPPTTGPIKTAAVNSVINTASPVSMRVPQRFAQTAAPQTATESKATRKPALPKAADAKPAESAPLKNLHKIEKPDVIATTDKQVQVRPEVSKPEYELTGARVARIVTCRAVSNRRHGSMQKVFSLRKDAKAFVWMDVRSIKVPYTIMLIYYHDGRRYCKIPLHIRYRRTRTWGFITLKGRQYTGKWHADVLLGDHRLAQVAFTVVP